MTEWRTIPGHERYEVSDDGQVRREGKILKGNISKYGYHKVKLDNVALRSVHQLVAHAFIGPQPRGYEVRHLNDIKTDNRLENLRYGTRTENMRDRVANGRDPNRRKTHCPQGHPYDEENTFHRTQNGRPIRVCIACKRRDTRERMARWRSEQKAKKGAA